MANAFEIITERIVAQLEKGEIPWHKPWATKGMEGCPKNFVSKRPYNGINFFMLATSGYSCPFWLTFNQAREKGIQIMKGEKSTPIVFWNITYKKNQDGEEEKSYFLRYFNVFNLQQTDYVFPEVVEGEKKEFNAIDRCEEIAKGYKDAPSIGFGGDRAYYSPMSDHVQMPVKTAFKTEPHYYATLFHEFGHSTGHSKRLNRKEIEKCQPFGSKDYSREELVAEMTSAFLCFNAGIDTPDIVDNTVAYLQGWKKALKEDVKAVVYAAGKAQAAANLILGKVEEDHEE